MRHKTYLLCALALAALVVSGRERGAVPAVLGAQAGSAALRQSPAEGIAPVAEGDRLASYTLRGGVAGFDTEVEIGRDGSVTVRHRLRWRSGQLASEDLGRLTDLAQRVRSFTTRGSGSAGATDPIAETATFYGNGQAEATDAEKTVVQALLQRFANDPSATAPQGEDLLPGALAPKDLAAALVTAAPMIALPDGFGIESVETENGDQDTVGGAYLRLTGPLSMQAISITVFYSPRAASSEVKRVLDYSGDIEFPTNGLPSGSFCKVSPRTQSARCYAPDGAVLVTVDLGAFRGETDDAGIGAYAVSLAQAALALLRTVQPGV